MKSSTSTARSLGWLGWVSGLGTLVLWQAVTVVTGWPEYLLPSPITVVATLGHDAAIWGPALVSTLTLTATGFGLALVFSLVAGVVLDEFPVLSELAKPLVVFSQTVPVFFVYPLLLLVLGFGALPLVVIVFLACFFPLLINFRQGLESAGGAYVDLLRTLGARRWQRVFLLKLPASLPALLSGLRLSLAYALTACVLGEYLGAREGLGVYMARSFRSFAPAQVMAAIVVVSVITLVLFRSIDALEKPLLKGRTS